MIIFPQEMTPNFKNIANLDILVWLNSVFNHVIFYYLKDGTAFAATWLALPPRAIPNLVQIRNIMSWVLKNY